MVDRRLLAGFGTLAALGVVAVLGLAQHTPSKPVVRPQIELAQGGSSTTTAPKAPAAPAAKPAGSQTTQPAAKPAGSQTTQPAAKPAGSQTTEAAGSASTAGPQDMTVTGEVVDLACYAMAGAKGDGHKGCAIACAQAGVPLGLLDGEGKLYLLISDAEPHSTLNEKLLADGLVATQITVTGALHTKPGLNVLVVSKYAKTS